uniref:Uncharacterized protein n=1 Tax=Strombidinopsis acuminata TaxID=141414 RepID=A0A7S3RTX2_9SPIT
MRAATLATLCAALGSDAQYSAKETASALRWWCEPGRGHDQGPLCLRWSLTDAIASATEESEKISRVDKLKAAIQKGLVDGQAVDATNPERHEMMDAWCADQSTEDAATKRQVCARVRNRKDFVARREVLLQWWCGEQGHGESVKCKQMEFGKKVESTMNGTERKALALEFKASQPADAEALIDEEQKEMMRAVCASIHGKDDLFRSLCKNHMELR